MDNRFFQDDFKFRFLRRMDWIQQGLKRFRFRSKDWMRFSRNWRLFQVDIGKKEEADWYWILLRFFCRNWKYFLDGLLGFLGYWLVLSTGYWIWATLSINFRYKSTTPPFPVQAHYCPIYFLQYFPSVSEIRHFTCVELRFKISYIYYFLLWIMW